MFDRNTLPWCHLIESRIIPCRLKDRLVSSCLICADKPFTGYVVLTVAPDRHAIKSDKMSYLKDIQRNPFMNYGVLYL